MNKRFSLLVLSFLVLVFVGAGCWTKTVTVPAANTTQSTDTTADTNVPETLQVTVAVDAGNDSSDLYLVEVPRGTSALAALQKAAEENNFTVGTKHYDFGDLVDSINNVASTGKKFWLFSVNGEAASVGAGAYTVNDGDTVEFVYTDSE